MPISNTRSLCNELIRDNMAPLMFAGMILSC